MASLFGRKLLIAQVLGFGHVPTQKRSSGKSSLSSCTAKSVCCLLCIYKIFVVFVSLQVNKMVQAPPVEVVPLEVVPLEVVPLEVVPLEVVLLEVVPLEVVLLEVVLLEVAPISDEIGVSFGKSPFGYVVTLELKLCYWKCLMVNYSYSIVPYLS